MKYPQNIYVASVDPMHFSHLNTIKLAKKELGGVSLVICKNNLKSDGLFSLDERITIAKSYLGNNDEVYCAENYNEVRKFLLSAERIVRGIRDNLDIEYIRQLAELYQVEYLEDKLFLVKVPESFIGFSSTRIKELVSVDDIRGAMQYANSKTVSMVKEKQLALSLERHGASHCF